MTRLEVWCVALAVIGCGGGGDDPPIVDFGEPTIVVIANPEINDVNAAAVAQPGPVFAGIDIALDTGPTAETSAAGIAVLTPVPAGTRTLFLSDSGVTGDVSVDLGATELREVAIAATPAGSVKMTEIDYDFTGTIVEVSVDTPVPDVLAALAASDSILLFRSGTYILGDITLEGSNVTLFGEGGTGGVVEIDGNLTVSGSNNRIRGAIVTGDLTIDGSSAGMSFSTVLGATTVTGSGATLLWNELCGGAAVSGSNPTALGNGGLAPVASVCP
jgi:hypothetical protein